MGQLEKIRRLLRPLVPRLTFEADYKLAAVLLPLIETPEGLSLLFEVRSYDLAWQPGEICFPGGRLEENEDAGAAALRETAEELSVAPGTIELLGPLDYTATQMGVLVYPYVGRLLLPDSIRPSRAEVAEIFTAPLDALLNIKPRVCKMQIFTQPVDEKEFPYHLLPDYMKGPRLKRAYDIYFYQYENRLIWGLTARILYDFLQKL